VPARRLVRGRGIRLAARSCIARLERRLTPRGSDPVPRPVPHLLVGVYRAHNGPLVERVIETCSQASGRAALWALDEPTPALSDATIGIGSGQRCALLNRLVDAGRPDPSEWIVICDDDISFEVGNLPWLLYSADVAGFAAAQPAHVFDSNYSYAFTRRRIVLSARATRFVEIGPVVAFSPTFWKRVFPLPEGFGMGWGLEALWSEQLAAEETFGIVDAVSLKHHGRVGAAYEGLEAETQRRDAILTERGLHDMKDLCRTTRRWPRWRPPW